MNQCVLHVIWGGNLSFSLAVQHLKGHLVITSSFRGLSESWAKDKSKRDCERLFVLYGSPPTHTHSRVRTHAYTGIFFLHSLQWLFFCFILSRIQSLSP